ncbi:PAS domain S-box protein [Bradyrhizobium sp. 40]|uniref:PAS domain S-box protein n=1 Tax=Bradyrhizobium sp. 40 TaxID=2782674 RepID=UPI001FFFF0BB|nr:PAS domain S-box protein [Bradyrhizobium sp. 40]UPJ43989.1 PAS domain S-box protein [Bradyrhizobium sp. 40]UPJ44078.1 PAS domain S-box protein [Bradyrhizobium sp. 40]
MTQKANLEIALTPGEIEAALRESEQRLRWLASIIESSDDAIISKNLDGIITSWNSGAERVFGYSLSEAIGQPITLVIPQDRQSEEREILTRVRRGERIDHFETVRQRKNGSLIVVWLTVSPVKDANGKIVGASKIARDTTEQKKNQELIATLAREAEHRSKNLLANAMATVNLSQSSSPEGLKEVIGGRIQALANVCSLFVETRWIGAEISAIAIQELAPYSDGKRTFTDGPQTLLAPDAAQAVAVALHELATNAAKYGALSTPEGHVRLEWSHGATGTIRLLWMETGGPVALEPTRTGFGTRIVEQMITQQKGKVRFDWRKDGLVCEITLPV